MIAQLLSALIFLVSLWLILSEKVNRTIIGLFGAVLMVTLGKLLHFYDEQQVVSVVDFNTLGLLLGMMILVALLEPTGFFQFLAVWAGRLSRGKPILLLVLLGTITTLVSMFLDNVTTVVLIAPVTILICEILGIQPTPYLIAEALLSNTGGTATLVGDPPNILIASAAGFTFVDFLTHSLPVVLFTWLAALWLLRYLFRHELAVQPPNAGVVLQLNPRETLDDPVTTRKVLIILGVAIVFFFFEDALKISPAFIALSAAAGALLWIRPDMQDILKRIEWSVLVFFASLFVIVGGLEASGVLGYIVSQLELLKSIPPVLFGLILLWFSAGLSAFVDNVPITIALIPVLQSLEAHGFNIQPLWWALAFGAGFGGNGTIIGSSANIVVASLSERTRSPITPRLWNRRGLPVMLLTCTVASILYLLLFPLFQR